MSLQLQHNGKTYEWIGDKWGEGDLEKLVPFLNMRNLVCFRIESEKTAYINTWHSPDQLIKLGYMRIVGEETEAQRIDKKITEKLIRDNVACVPCEMPKLEKEIELPEWKAYVSKNCITNEHPEGEYIDYLQSEREVALQVELLNNTVNKLLKK